MKDFLKSLLSRKFIGSLGSFLTFISIGQYEYALYVVLAYLGVNGAAELVAKYKTMTVSIPGLKDAPAGSDEVEAISTTGKIVSGRVIDEHKGDPDWE